MAQKERGLTAAELERETRKLAADLAFFARSPVNIQLVGGAHIAYTYNCEDDKKQHQIPIVMNPDTLKKVRNKEQAIKIWRGIGIHELAHHLFPASAQYKQANKEGFRHLFNLVDDEQNERRCRAQDPEWGSCLQSVCAHVFAKNRRSEDTLSPGIIDGEKEGRKPRGIAATKVYTQRWNQFAFHFRLHVPDPKDPIVAEALGLIDKEFKDLSKPDLLDLTRRIHEVLARGVEMPPPEDPEKKQEPEPEEDEEQEEEEEGKEKPDENGKEDEKEDEEKQDEQEEGEGEDEEGKEGKDGGWSVKALLTSKWMLIPFGLFIAIWTMLFLQGGIAFWLKVAIIATVGIVGLGIILFMRRALIKRLLAEAKARVTRSTGPPGTSKSSERSEKYYKLLLNARMPVLLVIGVAAMLGLAYVVRGIENPTMSLGVKLAALLLLVFLAGLVRRFADENNQKLTKWTLGTLVVLFLFVAVSTGISATGGVGLIWALLGWGAMALLFLGLIAISLSGNNENKGGAGGAGGSGGNRGPVPGGAWSIVRRTMREKWSLLWERIGQAFSRGWDRVSAAAAWCWKKFIIPFVLLWKGVTWVWTNVVVPSWLFCCKWTQRAYWKAEPVFKRLWRHTLFRLAVIAVPVAVLLAMLYAVAVTAAEASVWLLIVLLVLLLLLLLLGFLFRKKIKEFVLNELLMPMPVLMTARMQVPLDMETDWFVQVDNVVPVEPDQKWLDENLPQVYVLAQQLRPYLKKCGRQVLDREEQPDGYDLTEDAELALVGETSVFVNDDTVPKASVHLEVALDCSSSMESPTRTLTVGQKFLLGKMFALVLEQAVVNLPGVSAHFWGFTDRTIYDCGTAGEGRVSGLQSGGGNNDAAMLWKMGQSAAQSGKDVKILLMLSDGQPSECSWRSLHNLVLQFEQDGMIPWNFALDEINVPAFERFFTDLVGQTMEEAIITMGETLASIAQDRP